MKTTLLDLVWKLGRTGDLTEEEIVAVALSLIEHEMVVLTGTYREALPVGTDRPPKRSHA